MSDEKEYETHAAVIAEMRECDGWRAYYDGGLRHDSHEVDVVDVDYLHDFANRADAAHKREIDALTAKLDEAKRESRLKYITDGLVCMHDARLGSFASAVNAAKLREALEMFCGYAATVLNTGMFNRVHLEALLNKAKAALAAPPRQCDVGTADEQYKRFLSVHIDKRHYEDVRKCPLFVPINCNPEKCCFKWAQMSYTESDA